MRIIDFNINYLVPRYTLWFLITMMTYTLADFILEKVNYKVMIPLSFIIGLISGFIPFFGETLSLSRSFVFFPFYVLGYYAKDLDLFNKIKETKIKNSTIIISIVILIIILCFDDILSINILKGKYNYFDINSINPIIAFFQRLLFYGLSLIVTTAFLNLVPSKESFLTKLGRNTLYIYLTQGMILKTFITEKFLLNNEVLGTAILFFLACILTIIFTKIIKKLTKLIKYKLEVRYG